MDAALFLHPDRMLGKGLSPKRSPTSAENLLHASVKEPEDPYDLSEVYSIGNVSIEPKPRQSSTSIDSTGNSTRRAVRSLKSIRSVKSLGFKSSRESLRSEEEKVIRRNKRGREEKPERLVIKDYTPPNSPPPNGLTIPKRGTPHSPVVEIMSASDDALAAHSYSIPKTPYWDTSDADNVSNGTRSPGMLRQDRIPTRNSSRRHSVGLVSPNQKRRSCHSERSGSHGATDILIIDDQDTPAAASPVYANQQQPEQDIKVEVAEDFVTRRIRELKYQKMQRERSFTDSPTEFISAPETPNRILTPSPGPDRSHSITAELPGIEKESASARKAGDDPVAEGNESSAPSPAIASRTKRNSFVGMRPKQARDPISAASTENKRRSFSTPQRSNSRLLRRLSRPASPTDAEKHNRHFSNSMILTLSDQVEREDRDSIGDSINDFLSSPRLNQRIRHSQTGRTISFSEVGDPKGSVVFCCVGMGLTRFLTAFYDDLALTLKLRLITPDRPGVGGSEPHAGGLDTPLGWADDVRSICEHLKITKYSIMAHSAGAIYALATALRMPQHLRCRIHLLAPWIPPSQMSVIGTQQEPLPATALPYSQRILRALPTTFLRAANSSLLSTTSASITTSLPKSPRRGKRRNNGVETSSSDLENFNANARCDSASSPNIQSKGTDEDCAKENRPLMIKRPTNSSANSQGISGKGESINYETRLTEAIWEAATTGANPAVDLLVCLERHQPIGFRYVDITRAVVIHHGSKDTRVPVENARWLGKTMRRCEVRVLEGEGHGLMASAIVMSNVLMEMAQEWDDWNRVVKGKAGMERRVTNMV